MITLVNLINMDVMNWTIYFSTIVMVVKSSELISSTWLVSWRMSVVPAWGMWPGSCNTSCALAFRLGESRPKGPALVEILYALSEITGWKSEIK